MSYPLPQPDVIAEGYSAALDAAFKAQYPGIDTRGANAHFGVMARAHGQEGFALYLFQRSLADELMIDTAQDWLARHADQWGVPRIVPGTAIGPVVFANAAQLTIPADIELVDGDGNQWITSAGGTIPAGGTLTVAVVAELPGIAGNVPAGNTLTVISAVLGLQGQSVTVGPGGIAGGTPIETPDAWRARILARVRVRGAAGTPSDYIGWAKSAGALLVGVVPGWVGPGSVGVIVAVPDPAGGTNMVPTPAQVAAFQASIDAVRPVTAQAAVVAVTLQPVPLTLALNPDTVVARSLAQSAFAVQLAQVGIGGALSQATPGALPAVNGTLSQSKLIAAIADSTGGSVELAAPAADLVANRAALLIPGAVTFAGYA